LVEITLGFLRIALCPLFSEFKLNSNLKNSTFQSKILKGTMNAYQCILFFPFDLIGIEKEVPNYFISFKTLVILLSLKGF
jgi:hypothetical protein